MNNKQLDEYLLNQKGYRAIKALVYCNVSEKVLDYSTVSDKVFFKNVRQILKVSNDFKIITIKDWRIARMVAITKEKHNHDLRLFRQVKSIIYCSLTEQVIDYSKVSNKFYIKNIPLILKESSDFTITTIKNSKVWERVLITDIALESIND